MLHGLSTSEAQKYSLQYSASFFPARMQHLNMLMQTFNNTVVYHLQH